MAQDSHIGAHASALINLRMRSLEAYGIDPQALMLRELHPLIKQEDATRSLAKVSKESRAIAIQNEHALALV